MNFLKKGIGIIVGKIVLRAQLIPIGELRGLKWIWGKLFYTAAQRAKLNGLWVEFVKKNHEHKIKQKELAIEVQRELLPAAHGVKLDTVEMFAQNKDPKEYIVYGWGRSDCYEFYLHRLATDALNLNKRIITFNFRGVARSQGQVYSEQDLINDYVFQVKRLISQGVPANRIKCYGHSLCGAIATKAVLRLRNAGYDVQIYNDRSFANLIDTSVALYFNRPSSRARLVNIGSFILGAALLFPVAALGMVTLLEAASIALLLTASVFWKPTHALYDKIVAPLLERGMRNAMIYGGWVLDVVDNYKTLPHESRCHTVVKPPVATTSKFLGKRATHPGQDKVIPYEYSLHRHLSHDKQYRRDLKTKLSKANSKGKNERVEALRKMLLKQSNGKMTNGGHMTDPKELVTWYKGVHSKRHLSGQEHFYDFVEPNGKHASRFSRRYKSFS